MGYMQWVSLLKTLSEEDFKTYYHSARDKNIILHEHVGMYAWHTKHHLLYRNNKKSIKKEAKENQNHIEHI